MASKKPPHEVGDKYTGPAEVGEGINVPEERKTFDQLARGGAAKEHGMKKDEKKRAHGGGVDETGESRDEGGEGSGNPDWFSGGGSYVDKEAHKKNQAESRKGGGGVKRKRRARGGSMPMGKEAMKVEGKGEHHRLDRPRRAKGGSVTKQVGADTHPLTSASTLTSPKGDKVEPEDD